MTFICFSAHLYVYFSPCFAFGIVTITRVVCRKVGADCLLTLFDEHGRSHSKVSKFFDNQIKICTHAVDFDDLSLRPPWKILTCVMKTSITTAERPLQENLLICCHERTECLLALFDIQNRILSKLIVYQMAISKWAVP